MISLCRLGRSAATLLCLALCASVTLGAIPHVVHISVDGLGAVYLKSYLETAPEQFPNFARLKREAAFTFNARCDYGASETIPNHTCMFTGRPALQPAGFPSTVHHGLLNNSPTTSETYHNSGNLEIPYKASIFDVIHDYGLSTALFAGKEKLSICDRSYDSVNGGFDLIGEDNGRDKIDFSLVGGYADYYGSNPTNEVNVVVEHLMNSSPKTYTFVHIAEPDLTGHFNGGWGSINWSNMVRFVDGQIGRIFTAIESNPALSNRTIVILNTDHGGGGISPVSHSEPQYSANYIIPMFIWGPGIPAGADLYSLFANRADPKAGRPDYTVVPQPLRNGDTCNIALSLLGLPPIPGSLMQPFFASQVGVSISKIAAGFRLFWAAAANTYVLESAATLNSPVWNEITENIVEGDGLISVEVNSAGTTFYRLRKVSP
jgi:hypothetical protein